MLRKRTRSVHKDQLMSDSSGIDSEKIGQNHKTNPLFSVPGLLVGLSSKALTDFDSVRSPTSPLEFRVFSGLGNSLKSLRTVQDGHQKSQGCCKVGLGIIDTLDDDVRVSGKILRPSESKNILFGPRIRTKTSSSKDQGNSSEALNNFSVSYQTKIRSPEQNKVISHVLEIGNTTSESKPLSLTSPTSHPSVDSNAGHKERLGPGNFYKETVTSHLSSPITKNSESLDLEKPLDPLLNYSSDSLINSLSASDIELSEDYTCVISHGPNPKTTHIFCDSVLEDCQAKRLIDTGKKEEKGIGSPQAFMSSEVSPPYQSSDFLRVCHFCYKKLEDGEDIYIYRGDTSFCSMECRCQEMFMEEEMEKSTNKPSDSPKSDKGRKLFETGIFVQL